MKSQLFATLVFACTLAAGGAGAQTFTVSSPEVSEGGTIANAQVFKGFGCTGDNISPELNWTGTPAGTKSFAVTVYDPDVSMISNGGGAALAGAANKATMQATKRKQAIVSPRGRAVCSIPNSKGLAYHALLIIGFNGEQRIRISRICHAEPGWPEITLHISLPSGKSDS